MRQRAEASRRCRYCAPSAAAKNCCDRRCGRYCGINDKERRHRAAVVTERYDLRVLLKRTVRRHDRYEIDEKPVRTRDEEIDDDVRKHEHRARHICHDGRERQRRCERDDGGEHHGGNGAHAEHHERVLRDTHRVRARRVRYYRLYRQRRVGEPERKRACDKHAEREYDRCDNIQKQRRYHLRGGGHGASAPRHAHYRQRARRALVQKQHAGREDKVDADEDRHAVIGKELIPVAHLCDYIVTININSLQHILQHMFLSNIVVAVFLQHKKTFHHSRIWLCCVNNVLCHSCFYMLRYSTCQ